MGLPNSLVANLYFTGLAAMAATGGTPSQAIGCGMSDFDADERKGKSSR
jgi:hypothetical protein